MLLLTRCPRVHIAGVPFRLYKEACWFSSVEERRALLSVPSRYRMAWW